MTATTASPVGQIVPDANDPHQPDVVPPAVVPSVDFDTDPSRYRHWRLDIDGPVATLTLAVDPQGGLVPGYELKMNSYDLGVDIELYDAVQRLRFEHPGSRPSWSPAASSGCSAPEPTSGCSPGRHTRGR
ncbi:hypothetical protein [Gordonia sp. NPDC003429]